MPSLPPRPLEPPGSQWESEVAAVWESAWSLRSRRETTTASASLTTVTRSREKLASRLRVWTGD